MAHVYGDHNFMTVHSRKSIFVLIHLDIFPFKNTRVCT